MISLLAGLTIAFAAAQPLPSGWRVVSGPYDTEHRGGPCTVIELEGPAGATAQALRWRAECPAPGDRPAGWQLLSLPGAECAWWRDSGWGLQAQIWSGGWRYELTIRGARPRQDVVAAAWAAVTAALASRDDMAKVADVRARDPADVARELWVPAFAKLIAQPLAPPWLRPDGIVQTLVVGLPGPDGAPRVPRHRFNPATARVAFLATFRTTRRRAVRIVWIMGGRPVRASRAEVGPGSRLVGSLTASNGLPVGRYRLEIWSSSGLEARADFVVVPPQPSADR